MLSPKLSQFTIFMDAGPHSACLLFYVFPVEAQSCSNAMLWPLHVQSGKCSWFDPAAVTVGRAVYMGGLTDQSFCPIQIVFVPILLGRQQTGKEREVPVVACNTCEIYQIGFDL